MKIDNNGDCGGRLDTFLVGGAFAIGEWDWVKAAPVYLAAPALMLWVPFAHLSLWNYAGLAVASCASYGLIERPFLHLRDRPRTEITPAVLLAGRG